MWITYILLPYFILEAEFHYVYMVFERTFDKNWFSLRLVCDLSTLHHLQWNSVLQQQLSRDVTDAMLFPLLQLEVVCHSTGQSQAVESNKKETDRWKKGAEEKTSTNLCNAQEMRKEEDITLAYCSIVVMKCCWLTYTVWIILLNWDKHKNIRCYNMLRGLL